MATRKRRVSNKITLKETEMFIKMQLKNNKTWTLAALDKIATFQTVEEILTESTSNHNNIGFTGVDAKILTSFAKQYRERKFLTTKQFEILKTKMPKYWKQIYNASDKIKLENQVRVFLFSNE